MNARWVQLGRVALTFAVGGWLTGALVMATDADRTFLGSLLTSGALRSGVAALLGGMVWAPLLAWARIRWWGGALVGLLVGPCALYVFFFLWPHDWQTGRLAAWRTVLLFVEVYGRYLVPATIVFGALAAAWARRPVRPPRWMRALPHDEEAGQGPG